VNVAGGLSGGDDGNYKKFLNFLKDSNAPKEINDYNMKGNGYIGAGTMTINFKNGGIQYGDAPGVTGVSDSNPVQSESVVSTQGQWENKGKSGTTAVGDDFVLNFTVAEGNGTISGQHTLDVLGSSIGAGTDNINAYFICIDKDNTKLISVDAQTLVSWGFTVDADGKVAMNNTGPGSKDRGMDIPYHEIDRNTVKSTYEVFGLDAPADDARLPATPRELLEGVLGSWALKNTNYAE